jgi:hypothetical protein
MLAIIKTWLIPVSEGGFAGKTTKNIAGNIEEIFVLSLLSFVDSAAH